MAVPVSHFDTFTNEIFIKKLVDNFFLKSPLLMKLRKSEKTFDGGKSIRVPVSYKKSPNAGTWGGRMGVLPTNHVQHATEAIFDICYYFATVTMPQTDQWLNMGEAKIIDLLTAQMEVVEESLVDTLGTDLYGDGTVSSTTGYKRVDGLQALCTRNADGSEGAYGDISRASSDTTKATWVDNGTDNSWWNANSYAINANASVNFWKGAATIGNTTTLSIAKIQQLFGLCSDGGERPTILVGSQLVYDAYHALTQAMQRQVNDDGIAKAGFQALEYNGVPLVVDDLIGAHRLYALNLNHLKFMPHKIANFFATPWRQPTNQLADVKIIALLCNLVCDKPRSNGVMTGITG